MYINLLHWASAQRMWIGKDSLSGVWYGISQISATKYSRAKHVLRSTSVNARVAGRSIVMVPW